LVPLVGGLAGAPLVRASPSTDDPRRIVSRLAVGLVDSRACRAGWAEAGRRGTTVAGNPARRI